MEFMLTLACNWGCRDCCRGLESAQPHDSHVTLEQALGYIDYLRDRVYVPRLKVHGGDPVLNPWFERIILMFADEIGTQKDGKLFGKVKVQTAYPKRFVEKKYDIPWGGQLQLHCESVDDKNFKSHHIPWFCSPTDAGVLASDETPPFGTALTESSCELQKRCGRSFERWGFTACAQEAVIGRVLGIDVHSKEYKHWGKPEVCRHCPMCLGKNNDVRFQRMAHEGKFGDRVSKTLKRLEPTSENIVQLQRIYERGPTPWQPAKVEESVS
jgi:hypothetical protein